MKTPVFFVGLAMLALGIAWGAEGTATGPTEPGTTQPATRLSATLPTTAGITRLRFLVNIDGEPTDMCVVVCVSKKVAAMSGPVPTMFYLGGLGDHGTVGKGVLRNGPPAQMVRDPSINEQLPMMVVAPECPPNFRWAVPGMVQAMSELLKIVAADPRVDRNRLYLQGFSDGGTGAWALATVAAPYFAAISDIAGRAYQPDKCAASIGKVPVWVIVGDKDGPFTKGCREMAAALQKAGGNVVLSEMPGVAHSSWDRMYPKLEFYNWFLTYTRGRAATRPSTEAELDALVRAPVIDPVGDKARADFALFAPYWKLTNFSHAGAPGLRPNLDGHVNVFVVRPLYAANCVMETRWKIPADKHAILNVLVGREASSDWKLIIHIAGKEVLSLAIDKTSAPDRWYQKTFDLGAYSGRAVLIEVLTAPGTQGPVPAYFAKLAVEFQP